MSNKETSNDPLVSIICITYNQQDFLKQALESFLAQKTEFPIEVLVHDDASTDKTIDIITEYARKYPKIIKPYFEKKNQFSSGSDEFIGDLYNQAKGKYIAICEGDDFWTDPDKLQLQVDFLNQHPDYSICFHPVNVFFQDGSQKDSIYPVENHPNKFTANNLLRHNFIQANSVMYRNQHNFQFPSGVMPFDWYTHLFFAQFGKIGFINKVMSAYRRHNQGVWWESQGNISKIWRKHGIGHLKLYKAMTEIYAGDKSKLRIIDDHFDSMLSNIFDLEYADEVKRQVAVDFPDITQSYISAIRKDYLTTKAELDQLAPQHEALKDEYSKMSQHAKNIEKQLELIKTSKVWKARNKAARLMGKNEV